MTDRDTIIERLAKLLRMTTSSNEHEAMLAMQRAAELAAKHSIDLSEIEGADAVPEPLIHEWVPSSRRRSLEQRRAEWIARIYFHVNMCEAGGRTLYVGRAEDIQIARQIVAFLIKTSRAGLAAFAEDEQAHRRRMTPTKRSSYLRGWFTAINAKLSGQLDQMQLVHSRLALVLHDQSTAREATMKAVVPNTVSVRPPKIKRRNLSAVNAGYIDGRSTNLMPELPKPASTMLALPSR